jgi:magnesium transporter
MVRRRKRVPVVRRGSIGVSPGTLAAPTDAHPSVMSVMAYSRDEIVEETDIAFARVAELRGRFPVTWVNLVGLADVDLLAGLEDSLGIHRLALEDTLNTTQRPKLDDYGTHQYIVARMPVSQDQLETEQISIFMGDGFLLTVQERPGDCFESIRARIRAGRPRLREGGVDYLTYAILDALVDSYFPILEAESNRLDKIELDIIENPRQELVADLHDLKRTFVFLHRYLLPFREVTGLLMREDEPLLSRSTRVFMRDCADHVRQAIELVESYRDLATGLMDLYLSLMSQKMNEVMKVLTIISTVFIPLSFIAGLYGMNFDRSASRWNMPELAWPFGYPLVVLVMLGVVGGMLLFFRKRGWFR